MNPLSTSRHVLDTSMRELEHELLEMATRAEAMVGEAIQALCSLDEKLSYEVMDSDDEIDQHELAIENRCLSLLALQQPLGGDFREIGTILKVITDVERVGDLAVDIAKCALKIEKEMGDSSFVDIRSLGNLARRMFMESIQAFVRRDTSLIEDVKRLEDAVDAQYRELRGQIHDRMRSRPEDVVAASWMVLVVYHLERVADHALNIAERVSYMISGHLEQHPRLSGA